MDKGSNTLASLLGGTVVSSLASALGRYAGIGEGGSKSLLAPSDRRCWEFSHTSSAIED